MDAVVQQRGRLQSWFGMADRISTLSDSLLCHILSFLPTKVAVATSVLSKRWNPFWRYVPTLEFDDIDAYGEEGVLRFNKFVDAVMSSRDVNQSIKRFRFRGQCSLEDDDSNVDKWVNTTIQRGVEHLHLEFSTMVNLPSAVLSCRTLVVLKLFAITVKTLPSVDLPSLKIVNLDWVRFSGPRYLMELHSACPILEDLQMNSLSNSDSFALEDISENSLPMLVRADISNFHMPLKVVYNVKFLCMELEEVQLRYNDIPTFHNLTHIELIFENFSWHWTVELLKHCPKLQNLVIVKMEFMEMIEDWAYPQLVPECLSLHLRTCTLRNYLGLEGELMFARYIMQNARVLQTMTICTIFLDSDEKVEILKDISLCPRSSATCQLLFE